MLRLRTISFLVYIIVCIWINLLGSNNQYAFNEIGYEEIAIKSGHTAIGEPLIPSVVFVNSVPELNIQPAFRHQQESVHLSTIYRIYNSTVRIVLPPIKEYVYFLRRLII